MRANLDGVIFTVDAGAGWTERAGTAPHQASFSLPLDVANRLFKAGRIGSSKLTIESDELGQSITFAGLTIIGTSPTDSPYLRTVDVVDQRFFWARRHFFRRYNMRRRTGATRRAGQNAPRAVQVVADDVSFARYSLNTSTKKPWTMKDVIVDFMSWLAGPSGFDFNSVGAKFPDVEELEIDDTADVALARILAVAGGSLSVKIQPNGRPLIYPRLDGSEAKLVGQASDKKIRTVTRATDTSLPMIVGEPLYDKQERFRERPAKVRVLFERLPEIRIDVKEADRNQSVDPNDPPLVARNVVIVPEDVTVGKSSFVVGTPIPLDTYLTFLRGKQPAGLPNLTRTVINGGWLSGALDVYIQADFTGQWALRIPAIQDAYRSLFLIEKFWVDRLRDILPRRSAVEDYETGAQGAAPAYFHHAVQIRWQGLGGRQKRPELAHAVRNVWAVKGTQQNVATPPSVVDAEVKDLVQAPAKVSVDSDLGLISWSLTVDETAQAARYYRSALTKASIPTDNKLARNSWLQEGVLVDDFEASVIVTAVLGAPNDRRRYHVEGFAAKDVDLPAKASKRAEGPIIEVRIPAAKLPARYTWDDAVEGPFRKSLRESSKIEDPVGAALGEPTNRAELKAYARAVATRVYLSYVDRWVGGLTTGLNSSLTLRGAAASVAFEASESQGSITRVDLPGDPAPVSLDVLIPPEVRRQVDRLVDRKGG